MDSDIELTSINRIARHAYKPLHLAVNTGQPHAVECSSKGTSSLRQSVWPYWRNSVEFSVLINVTLVFLTRLFLTVSRMSSTIRGL